MTGYTSCELPLSQHLVQTYTQQQGLPLDAVYTVVEDHNRFLWIGTEDGLAQFDGRHFERIDLSATLGDGAEFVERLALTPGGDLLAGTANAGILKIDPNFPAQQELLQPLHSPLHALLVNADGTTVWAGARGEGLLVLDLTNGQVEQPEAGRAGGTVMAIAHRSAGGLWIGFAGEGLQRFEKNRFHDLAVGSETGPRYITGLSEDPRGRLWIAAREGLFRLDEAGLSQLGPDHGLPDPLHVESLLFDRTGTLWIGTAGDSLFRLCGDRFEQLETGNSLSQVHVSALFEDNEGGIWAATGGRGLVRISLGAAIPLTADHGLPDAPILPMVEDTSGAMWVGTFGGGVARVVEGEVTVLTEAQGLSSNRVLSLAAAEDGIWVGTRHGLNHVQSGRVTATYLEADGLPNETIASLLPDGDALWIGTINSLARFHDGQFETLEPESGFDAHLVALMKDSQGNLWIGTDGNGLFQIPASTSVPQPHHGSIAIPVVLSLFEDDEGVTNGLIIEQTLSFRLSVLVARRRCAGVVGLHQASGTQPQALTVKPGGSYGRVCLQRCAHLT